MSMPWPCGVTALCLALTCCGSVARAQKIAMLRAFVFLFAATFAAAPLPAQSLTAKERAAVENAVRIVREQTGAPAVSVAIARGNSVVYRKAFGWAVLPSEGGWPLLQGDTARLAEHAEPANAGMAFPIGSNSKAFTAVCVLLLQQEGKLRLDDPIARWLPDVTDAAHITIRELLTHTSGLPDDAPEPYLTAAVSRPITARRVAAHWGSSALDFAPGTRYEYSNTNYTLASLIVEKAGGMPFHQYLWTHVIQPLHLRGVLDLDAPGRRAKLRVVGHERYALGPLRPTMLEAPGWYAGAGELAMPASALAEWDLTILHRSLLKPAGYDAMERSGTLNDGTPTHYGFALHTGTLPDGKKVLYHGGVVEGFVSSNLMIPADRLAIVVLTNTAEDTAFRLRNALRDIFEPSSPVAAAHAQSSPPAACAHDRAARVAEAQVASILTGLQEGRLDRNALTPDLNFYFRKPVVQDFQQSLSGLGPVGKVALTEQAPDAGMTFRVFHARFKGSSLRISTYTTPEGKLKQFLVGRP